MTRPSTESIPAAASGIDTLSDTEILTRLHQGQIDAVASVTEALPEIAEGARCMSKALMDGGSLIYAGAGSSALMAAADAMELAGTFGIDAERVQILMAGGLPRNAHMPGNTEDDTEEADKAAQIISANDAIVVVTASGSTPYAVEIAKAAHHRGAKTICMANNCDASIFEHATVSICLPSGGEIIGGSTRMGAGSAQKSALNMMSTLMGIHLGHVHDGMMVNLKADNEKLKARALGMVCNIASVPMEEANRCLEAAEGLVKPAVLLAAGAESIQQANQLLEQAKGNLRAALNLNLR